MTSQDSGLPPAREFITSAGFGGAMALLAALMIALVVLGVGWRASKRHRAALEQRERHFEQARDKKARAADLALCEKRFRWVVETAGIEPNASENATLGLGPEVALELLNGLHSDARRLGDETLAKGISVYLNQFSLVLAQQGGPLSQLQSDPRSESNSAEPSSGAQSAGNAAAIPTIPASASTAAAEPEPASPSGEQDSESTPDTDSAAAIGSAAGPGRRRRR